MKASQKNYKRIVVKIGSSLLSAQESNRECFTYPMDGIAGQVAELVCQGIDMVVVSSGAIASGMFLLKMKHRPKELPSLQAVAAVGQHFLMSQYRRFFETRHNLSCGQILLTRDDFNDRRRYLNAQNTLLTLLKMKGIPIINENDTVATDEIKFGDNDILSALVANMVSADLLIILSDVDGLLEKDGRTLLRTVYEINPKIEKLACPTKKKTCVGGMVTKIEAAKIAMNSGIPCVIANGRLKNIVLRLAENPAAAGTLFVPKKGLAAKKRWIAFGVKPKGRIIVDDGARNALIGHKSLLAVGIVDIGGDFEAGDIVGIADKHYVEFARGKINFSSKQLERLKGQRLDKEVIHCDNISILT